MKNRKLQSDELGRLSPEEYAASDGKGFAVVLDNVRSAHNVGSAFRTADAFKADIIVLCGITATPPSAELHKTALGAEFSVPWKKYGDTLKAVEDLRSQGYFIVCVEQTENSVSLEKFVPQPDARYAFIFGNEVDGVAQEVAETADFCLEIPQFGTKHSLNVSVSIGAVLWDFISKGLLSGI